MKRLRYLTALAAASLASASAGCTDGRSAAEHPARSLAGDRTAEHVAPAPSGIRPLDAPIITDPAEVRLGKSLFFDTRLSRDDTISCASCHDLAQGGDDGLPTARGIDRAIGPFNTPTVLNSSLNFAQFWDGRAKNLVEQVAGPIHNSVEMDSNWEQVVEKLSADDDMVDAFAAVYDDRITPERIATAVAAYERALVATDSSFDRYLHGDGEAISAQAKRGFDRFVDLGCVACHQGRNIGGNIYQRFGVIGNYFADRGNVSDADYGRYNVTGREEDRFFFKVPSLRNVAETAPYFHDGSAETLDDAVAAMARYQLGRRMSDEERNDIVAFLNTLTGTVAGELL